MSNFVPEKTALGIEFGSTRIKAVLIGPEHTPLAQGDYTWENQLHNGIWTYPLEQVWQGLQSAYAALAADVQQKYGCTLTKVGCIGISAMMHGYLAFDARRRTAGAVPHLAQHHHRRSGRGADCGVRLQHPPALEHCPPVPGYAERRSASVQDWTFLPRWQAMCTGS